MQFFKKNNSSNNNEMQAYIKDVMTKLDYTPREDGLPDQQEGLGHYISKHKVGEGKVFEYAVVSTANPLTKEQMDIKMSIMDKDVKEMPAAGIEHSLTLRGPI